MAAITGYNSVLVPPSSIEFPNCSISVGAFEIEDSVKKVSFIITAFQNGEQIVNKNIYTDVNDGSASAGTLDFILNSNMTKGLITFKIDLIESVFNRVLDSVEWSFDYSKYKAVPFKAYMELDGNYQSGIFWVNDNGTWKKTVNIY